MRVFRWFGLGSVGSSVVALLQGCSPGEALLAILLLLGLSGGEPADVSFTLSVTATGTGSGTVTSSPTGIDCGSTCSADFDGGQLVILTATPDAGSTFAGWSGDTDCGDGSVTLSQDVSCTATFDFTPTKMYWTEKLAGRIQRANLDGSGVETLVTGLGSPDGIALDLGAGKMYWTDSATDKVQRANLDGSGVEALLTNLFESQGIALGTN